MDKLDAIKQFFSLWSKLPGFVRGFAVLCFMGVFATGYAYWYDNFRSESSIEQKIDSFKEQNDANWQLQFEHNRKVDGAIDSLSGEQRLIKKDIGNISIILAANSNDDLFNRLIPYLRDIKDDTYRLLLDAQRRAVMEREYKIGVRKKAKP